MPSGRLHLLYFIGYVFSAHFFGFSTKFGHSIPWPLDLDNHSVKQPQEAQSMTVVTWRLPSGSCNGDVTM
jgi:hypothetical protein